jgi:type III secretion system chaperone SycN
MALVETTLAELAASFQLPALRFNRKGVAAVRLGEEDLVVIEKTAQGDGVLLSLIRFLPPHRPELAEKILRLCGPEGGHGLPIRPGLARNGEISLTVLFPERDFLLSGVARCIVALREIHDRIRSS